MLSSSAFLLTSSIADPSTAFNCFRHVLESRLGNICIQVLEQYILRYECISLILLDLSRLLMIGG